MFSQRIYSCLLPHSGQKLDFSFCSKLHLVQVISSLFFTDDFAIESQMKFVIYLISGANLSALWFLSNISQLFLLYNRL